MKRLILILSVLLCGLSSARAEHTWGYVTSTDAFGSLGTNSAGSFGEALYKTGGIYSSVKLLAFRVPVCSKNMTNLRLCIGTQGPGSTDILSMDCAGVELQDTTYVRIDLKEPITLPTSGAYIGYTFTIPTIKNDFDKYPIGTCNTKEGYLYLCVNGQWGDFSGGQYGSAALQLIFEDLPTVTNFASLFNLDVRPSEKGKEGHATVSLLNDGTAPITSIDYTVTYGDVVTTHTWKPASAVKGNATIVQMPLNFVAPDAVGKFPFQVEINKVNGVDNEAGKVVLTGEAKTLTRAAKRYSVVEEFTGTGCGFCPRGWVGMNAVKEQCAEEAGVIALHLYNSTDPMYNDNYDVPLFSGAPQCTVDRDIYPDPYYGTKNSVSSAAQGIVADVKAYNALYLPSVVLDIRAEYNATLSKVHVSTNTEFLTLADGYTIAYVLTADGLTGTSASWKQSNYYYQYAQNQQPSDLRIFCAGGTYGKSSVALTFDDVMIASSWSVDVMQNLKNAVKFTSNLQPGTTEANEADITLPTKLALKNALNLDKIYATAIVFDEFGRVANAARCKVEYPEGIHSVLAPVDTDEAAFDLSGRQLQQPANGLLIQNGRKILRH